jgi:hypothetical protein
VSESLRGCEYKHDEVVPVELTKDHQIDPMYAYFKKKQVCNPYLFLLLHYLSNKNHSFVLIFHASATPAFPTFEDLPRTPGIAFDVFYVSFY